MSHANIVMGKVVFERRENVEQSPSVDQRYGGNMYTRTYQGSPIMNLLQAAAYSPPVCKAMHMAELWIDVN